MCFIKDVLLMCDVGQYVGGACKASDSKHPRTRLVYVYNRIKKPSQKSECLKSMQKKENTKGSKKKAPSRKSNHGWADKG